MSKSKPRQESLLDGVEPGARAASLVAIDMGAAPLSKAQRAFNRLVTRIRRLREELADWEEYETRYQRRLASELAPAERALRDTQRRLLQRLDELMQAKGKGERLSRGRRERVRAHILTLIDELLATGEADSEIDALQEKYTGVSREEREREELELTEALLGEMFGAEAVEGHEAADVDELLRFTKERVAERAAAEDAAAEDGARRHRKRSKKAELAAERKEQARRDAQRSVRDIYRRLASTLHPDREAEPDERERKTVLMQRVNQAYERSDLLELLSLQVEIEQIHPEHLAQTPEERIGHFNEVLREQQRALDAELEQRLVPYRMLVRSPARRLTTSMVDRELKARIARTRALCRRLEVDLERLNDPREQRAFIDELPDPNARDAWDADEIEDLLLLDALLDAGAQPAPARRRKKKKKKKRGGRGRR